MASRKECRARFVQSAGADAQALSELLGLGGVWVSSDGELLAHLDFQLGVEPLDSAVARVVATHVSRESAERRTLVVGAAAGRIRDRARAACLLGWFERLDEEARIVLHGLVRDPTPLVWRAASRATWRQCGRGGLSVETAASVLQSADEGPGTATLRRHLAGGLAGLLTAGSPGGAALAAQLIDAAAKHGDVWTRAAAAISCGECAVLAGSNDVVFASRARDLAWSREAEVVASLFVALREAGRSSGRREWARRLVRDLIGALDAVDPSRPDARLELARARAAADAVLGSPEPDAGLLGRAASSQALAAGPQGAASPGADLSRWAALYERTLERAMAGRPDESFQALHRAIEMARGAVEAVERVVDAGGPADPAAECAWFREVAEREMMDGLTDCLVEVVCGTAEQRRAIRGAVRGLHHLLGRTALRMCTASTFVVAREGMRAIALAMDARPNEMRDAAPKLIGAARARETRRHAAQALARLLARLHLDHLPAFWDVALRVALQPDSTGLHLLERLIEFSPAAASSDLALLGHVLGEIRAGLSIRQTAARLDHVVAAARRMRPEAGDDEDAEAVRGLDELAQVLRYLGGRATGGWRKGLDHAVEVLARCEANLAWDEPLPDSLGPLVLLARGLGEAPAVADLAAVGRAVEQGLASVPARALAHALLHPRIHAARSPSAPAPFAPQAGATYHGYRLVRLLSETNFSVVGLGLRTDSRRRVILKFPTSLVWSDPRARDLFRQEGLLLQAIPSEHVVRAEAVFDCDPPMLVLQHLDGRTLDQCLQMDRRWLLRRCAEVVRGLRHVHDTGIVHRDLKPSNVIVVRSDRAVIIDFGIAWLDQRLVTGEEGPPEPGGGTPLYMAPEQWLCMVPTAATDIYALGVLLYEILSGSPPFPDGDLRRIQSAHLTQDPPPLGRRAPAVLGDVVMRMLAKRPEERPGLSEVREAIEAALADTRFWEAGNAAGDTTLLWSARS